MGTQITEQQHPPPSVGTCTFILNEEIVMIKQEIPEDHISISFDGTTHAEEAFVVVQHFADDEWRVKQRVGGLMLLAKSLSSEEVACLLVETSFKELGINLTWNAGQGISELSSYVYCQCFV